MITQEEAAIVRQTACAVFGVGQERFDSRDRDIEVVLARYAAWYAVKKYRPGAPYRLIGRLLGYRDGNNVMKALKKTIPNEMRTNLHFAGMCSEVASDLSFLSQSGRLRENIKTSIAADLRALAQRLCSGNAAHLKRSMLQIAVNIETLL